MRKNIKQLRAISYAYTKQKHKKVEQIMDENNWWKEYNEAGYKKCGYKNVVNFLRIKKNIRL